MATVDRKLVSFLGDLPWPVIVLDAQGNVLHGAQPTGSGAQDPPSLTAWTVAGSLRTLYPAYYAALQGVSPWLSAQEADVSHAGPHGIVHERLIVRPMSTGACLIVTDRTEAHALAVADVQTARLASLGFMVAGVCHELSNPLTAIRSMTDLLTSGDDLDAAALRKGLVSIDANVKRLLNISAKLLDFSRVSDRPRMAFPVDEAIHDALSVLQQDRHFKNVTVSTQPDPEAVIFGDMCQIQEVFCNIALNAAQAMGGAGNLSLITRREGDSRVEVLIRDNGPGIPAQLMARLIEPFFTTKPAGSGTGLGLTISNEIIDEHNGTIAIENNADRGATFAVRLPLYSKKT